MFWSRRIAMDYLNKQLFRMLMLVWLISVPLLLSQGMELDAQYAQLDAQADQKAAATAHHTVAETSNVENKNISSQAEAAAQPTDSSNPSAHKFCVSFWMVTTGENQ